MNTSESAKANILDLPNAQNESEFFKAISKMYDDISTITDIPEKEIKFVVRFINYTKMVHEYSPEAANQLLDMLQDYYKVIISKK